MDASDVVELVIAFVAGINLPVIVLVYHRLGQIRDHLIALNDRVVTLEANARSESKSNCLFRERSEKDRAMLWEAVEKIKTRCTDMLEKYMRK